MPRSRNVDAIVLAGGGARRMGGVDKPGLTVGQIPLVKRVLGALPACRRTVVVGPHREGLDTEVLQVREEPAGSGPVAALDAGLAALGPDIADVVLVLAADIPFVEPSTIDALVRATENSPAAFVVDDVRRIQYLLGAWQRRTVVDAVSGLDSVRDASLRSLVPVDHALLDIHGVEDCDTLADLRAARRRAAANRPNLAPVEFGRMRSVIRDMLTPLPVRSVPVSDAFGTVLATSLVAAASLPHVDTSAMDGYAVCGDAPWTIRDDVAYAGTSNLSPLSDGQAVRIATGAAVPTGATTVIRDEFVTLSHGVLLLREDIPARDDRRLIGEDWHTGDSLVPAGTPVSAAVMSVALGAEVTTLSVRGPVRARILSSGNEIRATGPLHPGQTRDTIGPVIGRYLSALGIDLVESVHLADSTTAFDEALAEPGNVDLAIVIGATGGGAADRLRAALVSADAAVVVDRVAVRPGGSQITAVLPSGLVVLGLPGNPFAAIGTTMSTAPAIVGALTARTSPPPLLGFLTNADAVRGPVTRLVPVTRHGTNWTAETELRTAHLLNLTSHDALAAVPPDVTSDVPVELFLLPQ